MTRPTAFSSLALAALAAAVLCASSPARAVAPPCNPCAGVTTPAAHETVAALQQAPKLQKDARLFVRWRHDVLDRWDPAPARAVAEAGGTPWVEVVFHTSAPLVEHAADLERELAGLAQVVHDPGPVLHFEVVWEPQVASAQQASPPDRMSQYAFLLKRAAVVVTGGVPDARVVTGPLAPDPDALRTLYAQDVAAYVDGVVLQGPADDGSLHETLAALQQLDPGRPVSIVGLPWPEPAEGTVAEAARLGALGVAIAFFDQPSAPEASAANAKASPDAATATAATAEPAGAATSPPPSTTPEAVPALSGGADLAPLVVLANETHGDLSYDASSAPSGLAGGSAAWAFVRASDLGVRVVARRRGDQPLQLAWTDPTLTTPEVVNLHTGEARAIAGATSGTGVQLRVSAPVVLLRLARREAPDLQTIRGSAEVHTQRQVPVEEILRRLQAFEDAQARRLDHYEATNTTHLRFQGVGEQAAVEVTFRGPFFFRQGKEGAPPSFDWAWKELFLNGVKWRGSTLPEIPLIQPEKAAAMPLQIHFSREYRYRLRGTDTVNGRPVWVVDFEPAEAQGAASGKLYQGTVWIDQQVYGRVRTRALQVGLAGDVISNEETLDYTPVDQGGRPAAWSAQALWLPLHVKGQQILSIVNTTTVIEKETQIGDLVLNGEHFAEHLAEVQKSDVTMVRDTDKGLRYLVKQPGVEGRVVKEGYEHRKLFLLGGIFYDDALDYPLPLAGVNYFTFDLKNTGNQANVFFAGALLQANIARPKLGNTRFDAGADAFALAVGSDDTLYRDGAKVTSETVKTHTGSFALHLGRPLGSFLRLGLSYDLNYFAFGRSTDTAKAFVLPSDHVLHSLELEGRYSRAGYRITAAGSWHHRSSWDAWGMPGGSLASFDPDTQDYSQWELRGAKSWYLPRFQRLGLEVDYLAGDHLDRFSKYQFGFFGSTRVHGYSSGKVRAEKVEAAHVSYGLGIGEVVRLDLVGDAAWATDRESALSNELLSGVGLAGSFMGPWQTVVQIDVGTPVAGPDSGFVAYLVFLKLFR